MIKLELNTPIYGDCTAGYAVILDKEYSVKEFIDELRTKGECGEISIFCDNIKYSTKYGRDNTVEGVKENLLLKRIKKVDDAYGGWGEFNYTVRL